MSKTIRRELVIPQPRPVVWQAITDSATLAEWMYPNDFEPRVGHRFTFRVPPNPKVGFEGLLVLCEVLECEPPSRLMFTWSAGALVDTQVSFQLETEGDGTRVLFEHAGFTLSESFGEHAYQGAEYGWAKMLKQLVAVVADKNTGGESKPSMRLEQVDHVALRCSSLEATKTWYIDTLGFEDAYSGQWGGVPIMLRLGSTLLALFPEKPNEKPAANGRAWHLAFRAATYADFQEAQAALQARGVSFQFQDHEISHSIYFSDPDGFLLEITTYDVPVGTNSPESI